MRLFSLINKIPLWQQILAGLVIGVVTGLIFREQTIVLQPIGTIFLNLVRMVVVPLLLASIVSGLSSFHDPHRMGRASFRAIMLYLLTSAIAVAIGLTLGTVLEPGAGAVLPPPDPNLDVSGIQAATGIVALLVSMFPANPVAAMAEGNMLQIIVFAAFLGVALNITGKQAEPIRNLFQALTDVMITMTMIVMKIAPIGVFAIMAVVTGKQGLDVLGPLLKLLGVVYLGCLLQIIGVYGILIKLLGRISPLPFFRKFIEAQLMALSTCSSAATLPVTMRVTHEKLGVSNASTRLVLPIGMTVNMDGSALNIVICCLFVAQAAGIDLTMVQYIIIMLAAMLGAIGAPGIPSAGGSAFLMAFAVVGLPFEGVALILVIDRVSDMMRTVVNVTGDAAVALVVDRMEGLHDEEVYHA